MALWTTTIHLLLDKFIAVSNLGEESKAIILKQHKEVVEFYLTDFVQVVNEQDGGIHPGQNGEQSSNDTESDASSRRTPKRERRESRGGKTGTGKKKKDKEDKDPFAIFEVK